MKDKLFPRWCRAVFFLFSAGEIFPLPAAALFSLPALALGGCLAGAAVAAAARFSPLRHASGTQRVVFFPLFLLPAGDCLWRAAVLYHTGFSALPVFFAAALLLAVSVCLSLAGTVKHAMWCYPIAVFWAALLLLFCILLLAPPHVRISLTGISDMGSIVRSMVLPAVLAAFFLPPEAAPHDAVLGTVAGFGITALFGFCGAWRLGRFTAALVPNPALAAASLASFGGFAAHGETVLSAAALLCLCGKAAMLLCLPCSPRSAIMQTKEGCAMNIQIFGRKKCFDTKKAQRWFKERGIRFQMIDLSEKGISRGELDSVLRALGGLSALLDPKAKDAALLQYLADDTAKIEKVLEDPSLLRTPIVRNGRQATVGCCPEIWSNWE